LKLKEIKNYDLETYVRTKKKTWDHNFIKAVKRLSDLLLRTFLLHKLNVSKKFAYVTSLLIYHVARVVELFFCFLYLETPFKNAD